MIVATKFGIPLDEQRKGGAHPDYIRRAVDDSLKRLGTDYIDLYQLHRPDPSVPIADTLGALEELKRAGAGMKEPVVVINADSTVTHQSVVRVMDAARQAGYGQIAFAVEQAGK